MTRASLLDGFISADPIVAGILIGAICVLAIAFVVLRVLRSRRERGGSP